MTISKQEKQKIEKRAQEGKTCAQIQREDFPNLTWWDVRWVLEQAGTSSSLGIMKTISGKLNKILRYRGNHPPNTISQSFVPFFCGEYERESL